MGSAASITAESLDYRLANLTDAQIQGIEEILNKGPSKNRSAILSLLADLSAYEENQAAIISPNYIFMRSLLAVLSGTAEEAKTSLKIFARAAAHAANKKTMLSPQLGLGDKLVEILRKGSPIEQELVLTALRHLCTERGNVDILVGGGYDIVGVLVSHFRPSEQQEYLLAASLLLELVQMDQSGLLGSDKMDAIYAFVSAGLSQRSGGNAECRAVLLKMFSLLAEARVPVSPIVVGGLPILTGLLPMETDEYVSLILVKTIECIVTKVGDAECAFKTKQSDLIYNLKAASKTANPDIYLHLLNILYQLSEWSEHVAYMCDASLGIVSFLVSEVKANPMKEQGDECLIACLMTMINISIPEQNKAPMAVPALGVVLAAKEVVLKNKGLVRLLALKILMDLSMSRENVDYMATAEVDLFLVLMEIVFQFEPDELESISCCLEIIQHLLPSQQNKKYVSSLQLGIMKLMMAVIDRDVGDPTRIALLIIYNIALDPDGVVFVAAALHLGLHEKLGLIIAKSEPSSPQASIAWGCLSVVSKTAEHVEYLVDQPVFLKLLEKNLNPNGPESVRLIVLSILMNLVKDVELVPKVVMPNDGVHFVAAILREMNAKHEGYTDCLRLVLTMSRCRAVLEFLADPALGLLHALTADLANTGHVLLDGPAREVILEIISNLANSHSNVEHMLSSEANLYKVLLTVVRDDRSVAEVVLALKSIQQFSLLTKNAILMASTQFGLLKRLLTIIRDQRDQRSNAALSVLSNLSAVPETVETMGSEEAGQIVLFADILRNVDEKGVVIDVLKVLKSLSAHSTSNKIYMASSSHGLVAVILDILTKTSCSEVKENALKILRNLSGASKNQAPLAAAETGLLGALYAVVESNTGDARTVALAVLRNLTYDKKVAATLVQPESILIPMLNGILEENQISDSAVNCLSTLQNLSSFSENIDAMASPDAGVVGALLAVIRCGRVESKALGFRVLRNLGSSTTHAAFLVSTGSKLLATLFDIIKEGRDVDVTQCLQILAVLTSKEASAVFLASKELGLLRCLVDIVKEDHAEARGLALASLANLSSAKDNLANFTDEALPVLPVLSDALKESLSKMTRSADSRTREEVKEALRVVLNVCADDGVKLAVVTSTELGFLRTLIDYLKLSAVDECKVLTLRIMHRLTSVGNIKASFGSPEAGLVVLLRDILLVSLSSTPADATLDVVHQALNVLLNVSTVRKNMGYMGSEQTGLVAVLVMAVNRAPFGPEDKKRVAALSVLQNISCADETLAFFGSDDAGIVKLLFKLLAETGPGREEFALSLGVLRNMSTNDVTMRRVCEPKLGLYAILAIVLSDGSEKEKLNALAILQNVSCAEENILSMGRPETGLVPVLMAEVRNQDPSQRGLVNTAIDVIRNLSSMSANVEYLISAPLRVLDSMVDIIQRDGDADTSINALGALCNFADEYVVSDSLLEKRVHSLAIAILSKDRDQGGGAAWGEDETLPICALIYLMNMAQWGESWKVFEEEGVLTLLQHYVTYQSTDESRPFLKAHTLRAFMTVLFLVRFKEEAFYWDLLNSGPLKIEDLIGYVESAVGGHPHEDCDAIPVKTLLRASTCMFMNVANMATFATPRLVKLYVAVLRARREGPASPRGTEMRVDLDCAEVAVQGLVGLSLRYPDDEELCEELLPPPLQGDLLPMLADLSEKATRIESKQYVLYLQFRMKGREGIGYAKPFSSHKHVMLSSAQDKASKNDLVVSLQASLAGLGYEVWTEAAGSMVAPEVSNKTLENQVARLMAVKTSAAIVVCVSRTYKQTLLTRMDVTLAPPGCQFVFALMESDFGVDTAPDRIDGWLAGLMRQHGAAPVLRLWLSAHVGSAAEAIAEHLGDGVARHDVVSSNAGGGGRRGGNSVIAPMEASLLGISDDEVTKYNTAWEILQTSTNSIDFGMLSKYLDNIGVYDALDLRQCDEDDIAEITKLLKKIQRKVFSTCVQK